MADAYARALERLAALARFGMQPGLERIEAVLAALGNPERALPALHIAGTNGKGSTAAIAEALLAAAGARVGLYTSPHLCRVTERIRVGGEEIARAPFAALLDRVLDAPGGDRLTFFEALTAVALVHFAEERVDVAVLEAGLGGRLDATNVCHPFATVITSIGLDHTEVLGSTTRAIAVEKAGIAKRNVPLYVGRVDRDARWAIEARARSAGAPVTFLDHEFPPEPLLPLAGPHQRRNFSLAVAAVEHAPGFALLSVRFPEAMARLRWPGRLEQVTPDVLLDAAHNPDGAAALAAALPPLVATPPTLLLGVLADKDARGLLAPLLPLAARVVSTRPDSPRALPAADLAALARSLAPSLPVDAVDEPAAALAAARAHPPVLCCGSIVLVGAVRALLTGERTDAIRVSDPRASAR